MDLRGLFTDIRRPFQIIIIALPSVITYFGQKRGGNDSNTDGENVEGALQVIHREDNQIRSEPIEIKNVKDKN